MRQPPPPNSPGHPITGDVGGELTSEVSEWLPLAIVVAEEVHDPTCGAAVSTPWQEGRLRRRLTGPRLLHP